MSVQMDKAKYQTGSAMVEFTMILGVLLPVGLGMAMLGKLTDLQQTAEQAGRYSAWEATVYSRQALGTEQTPSVDERFFRAQDGGISSQPSDQDGLSGENALWGESQAGAGGLRSLSSVSRVAGSTAQSSYNFDTGKALASLRTGQVVAAAGRPLANFNDNSWGLVADGLLRSSVDVAVKPTGLLHALNGQCGNAADGNDADQTPAPDNQTTQSDNGEPVCIRAAGVILADGWSATGDEQVVSRVRSLVPGSALSRVGEGVGALLGSVVFPELDSLSDAFGHVDMSVLPDYAKP